MAKSAFHEIGLKNADELVTRSKLLTLIAGEIRKRKLTQVAAGELLGLDQPNVSALMNEKISRFSLEKLMMLVARLGFKVSIEVKGKGVALSVPVKEVA